MGDQMTKGAGAGMSAAPTWTVLVFVAIALLAVLTIIGIIWGVRLSRRRNKAEHELEERAEETDRAEHENDGPTPTPQPSPTPPPASPPPPPPSAPVASPPPPLSRGPAIATPAPQEYEAPAPDPMADARVAAATPTEDHSAAISVVGGATPPNESTEAVASPADGHVTQLKGLGPKVAGRLAEQGIKTVGQIAALDADQAQALDARLGPFSGRMERDRWIEQARFLAAGDREGFEAVFGKL